MGGVLFGPIFRLSDRLLSYDFLKSLSNQEVGIQLCHMCVFFQKGPINMSLAATSHDLYSRL
jgi:hypothetical protein